MAVKLWESPEIVVPYFVIGRAFEQESHMPPVKGLKTHHRGKVILRGQTIEDAANVSCHVLFSEVDFYPPHPISQNARVQVFPGCVQLVNKFARAVDAVYQYLLTRVPYLCNILKSFNV